MRRNLDQLLCGRKGAVAVLPKHLLHPFIFPAIHGWWEEHGSEDRYAILVSRVDRIGAWRHDDAFSGRASPIDKLVNILPIGKRVGSEFV
ncbi:hypothetical protein D3C73_988230 [compost metagenome]